MSQATIEIEVASCCNIVIYGRFHDYPMFRGRTMGNQEEQSLKEAKRAEKHAAEEAERLAKEQAKKKAYLAREKATAEDREAKKLKNKKQPPE